MTFLNGVFKNVGGVAEIFGKLNLNLLLLPQVSGRGVCVGNLRKLPGPWALPSELPQPRQQAPNNVTLVLMRVVVPFSARWVTELPGGFVVLPSFILTSTWPGGEWHPYFTGKKTEPKELGTCPKPHSQKGQGLLWVQSLVPFHKSGFTFPSQLLNIHKV